MSYNFIEFLFHAVMLAVYVKVENAVFVLSIKKEAKYSNTASIFSVLIILTSHIQSLAWGLCAGENKGRTFDV